MISSQDQIFHGAMGHKDYLFQKTLAERLPYDSFRFDFRGNAETGGRWKLNGLADDVDDINAVAFYLQSHFGYIITYAVGHSRGSLSGSRWVARQGPGAQDIRGWVNISGRFRMEKVLDWRQIYEESFKQRGYYDWEVKVAGQRVIGKIYPGDLESFADWDMSHIQNFPQHIHALTIHGLQDKVVPPYDALLYARNLNNRAPGTHNLHFIEDADHNFVGFTNDVTSAVLEWISAVETNSIVTGIWRTGVPYVEVIRDKQSLWAQRKESEEGVQPLDGLPIEGAALGKPRL